MLIGMTVEVNVVAKKIENALIVPAKSIVDSKVWLKKGKKIIERRVKTGIANEQQVQILDGRECSTNCVRG